MAFLDLSDAFDPAFLEDFTVIRRTENFVNGRAKLEDKSFPAYGSICAATPNQLQNLADARYIDRAISVVTQFHAQGPVAGKQPDLIVWKGSSYQVSAVDNYPHLGVGFFQIVAISTTSREGAV